MFKFWRSPKPAPSSSPSPAPPSPPPARRDDPTAHSSAGHAPAVHGLGLGLPTELDHARLSPHTRLDGRTTPLVASTRGASAASDDSQAASRTAARPDKYASAQGAGLGSVLRERNGTARNDRSVSEGTAATAQRKGKERAVSPASFSPSFFTSGSARNDSYAPHAIDFGERDPTQIYAPTTWSEMAHHELVVNLSPRERTRQEILWEVVASEERYVAELRSLVELYSNPLLHPLIKTPSHSPATRFGFSPEPAQTLSPASSSSADLPIASRFARSPDLYSSPGPSHEDLSRSAAAVRIADVPEIPDDTLRPSASTSSTSGPLGRSSLPNLPTGARRNLSSTTLDPQSGLAAVSSTSLGTRIASAFKTRHPLRPASSAAKLHRAPTHAPQEVLQPPPLPEALKKVLEATIEMLRGHEELSARLKEQWARAFPLVRGLAAIWSDQPWFLSTYTTYIVSLEEALSILDTCLPSAHSAAPALGAGSAEKWQKRLTRVLMRLEEQAAEAGESSLGICLSKPLMRLGKLPLLMQALLYHTDPTTHEWEKTRAMALEVDALVRSIEDEKIEEEERERTRDVLARIDGINDKALMAPRTARILIDESLAPPSASTPPTVRNKLSRRLSGAAGSSTLKSSTRSSGKGQEYLIRFTDVIIRAQKTGETDIPGSFSRGKEKKGKPGKTRKAGKIRNTYRFVRVERWEPREMADAALYDLNERRRAQGSRDNSEATDEELDYAESRMSFRYDADSPQPVEPRSFLSPQPSNKRAASSSHAPSPLSPPSAKFGARLRYASEDVTGAAMRMTTPDPRAHRFNSPTVSSTAKVHHRPTSPPRSPPRPAGPAPVSLQHARDDSAMNLYSIWAAHDC
ncbi:uncharacterized protein JCM10292_003585 [Rhodotorula paludigena]|uniref:uncharacterized protein n=1 Tax=Rhodotorula paludigena TaxID=86838 RepID=UPI00316F12A8